jgi:serine/threonine protein kinase
MQTLDEASIFFRARQIAEVEERLLYIQQACGDDTLLKGRIEALLRAHEKPGNVLDSALVVDMEQTAAELLSAGVGTVVAGRYKLQEKVGEGGMGAVWIAEQVEPVRRKVAVKLIKPGMDSQAVVRRFEAERQALAMMDHPHIAKVLDGGLTQFGRPFFVMEYFEGVPITQGCDAGRLGVAERLRLFMQVCKAVQHAHQKGIIHRDLKPSNILMAPSDDAPAPKVIDFGLAKAVHEPLTGQTMHTSYGMLMGTALYMSPEQARHNNLDVDTRTDIYSLGVVLYELLTGTTPLDWPRLKHADWDEIRRLISDEEPPRPSARVGTNDALPSAAACRKSDPVRLSRLLRGELDWIVLKAVAKDRGRRYETASGLARDIERYLNNEPVEARPPSPGYRLAKFVRRNKGLVRSLAAIFLLLVAGVVAASVGFVRAEKARREADQAREAETEQRKFAEAREAETQAVLQFVEKKVFAAALPKTRDGGLGPGVTLRRAVEAALPYVDQGFAGQPLTEARLRMSLGLSFYYLGDYRTAADQYEKARTLFTNELGPDHADTLRSMGNLANNYSELGRNKEALQLREQTLATRSAKLGPEHPDTLDAMNAVADSYAALGRNREALELFEETLTRRQAILGPDNPETLRAAYNIGRMYLALGRPAEALKLHEAILARRKVVLGPYHADTLWSMNNVAIAYFDLRRFDEAREHHEETLALRKATLGPDHPDTLTSMNNLAFTYALLGRNAEALKLWEQKLEPTRAKLGPDHPRTLSNMYNLACVHARMIPESNDRVNHADLAMEWLQKAVAAGFRDMNTLKKDNDFDALRNREDFKKLIRELEARKPTEQH